jgi:hypothetical protein
MNRKELVCYNSDASGLDGKAEKVVFPEGPEEVQKIVKGANMDLVPRGGGSGVVGGCVPNGSIVIDMSKMNAVTKFNNKEQKVRAEAGVTIKELNEKLLGVGFEFPIVPPGNEITTIGGMIAVNASGDKSMKYGTMKDWIEEIEFVNGRGEMMRTSKTDLRDVCGMEGITGVIVAATLKIIPAIQRTASVFQSEDLAEVLSIARRLKLEEEVAKLELFSPQAAKFLGFPKKYHLIIEFDSDRGKIKGDDYKKISILGSEIVDTLFANGYYHREDPRLFFDKLEEFMTLLEEYNIPYSGYLGSGIVYPFFREEDKPKRDAIINFVRKTRAKSGQFGVGLTRRYLIDSFEEKVLKRVKLRHDPFGKFNKGKMIESEVRTINDLRKLTKNHIATRGAIAEPIPRKKPVAEPAKKPMGRPVEGKNVREEIPEPERHIEEAVLDLTEEEEEKEEKEYIAEFPKPLSGEERSADQIVENIKKSASEKMDEFIKEMSEEEKNEINERLKDYKDTYESELAEDKMRDVEEFAKNVSKTIIASKPSQAIEKSADDYDRIKEIMTNNVVPDDGPSNYLELIQGNESSKDESKESKENKDKEKSGRSLITDIMTNRYNQEEKDDSRE